MAKEDSLVVDVPSTTRTRSTSADPAIVAKMVQSHSDGKFVTNGKTYKTYKDAGNDAQIYRRAFARAQNLGEHQIVSRTWGMDGDVVITDKEKPGTWKFALTVNRERQKRTRNRAK